MDVPICTKLSFLVPWLGRNAKKRKAVPLHAVGAPGREEIQLLLIHDLGSRLGWVVSVTPRPRFTPGERTPGTHCTGGWVGPRAGLDIEARGKILCPCRGSNPDRPVVRSSSLPELTRLPLCECNTEICSLLGCFWSTQARVQRNRREKEKVWFGLFIEMFLANYTFPKPEIVTRIPRSDQIVYHSEVRLCSICVRFEI
jgi:hypothetical protein